MARSGRVRRGEWWGLALVAVLATGCGMPPPGWQPGQAPRWGGPQPRGQGPGGRQQVLALSPQEELQVGRQAYQKVLQEFRGKIVSDNRAERIRAIVVRLVGATKIQPLLQEINLTHVREFTFEWNVKLVESSKVNAFCLPAGEIVVFTGLLRVAEDDDQLATVLGHEMAHALAHHASERIARQQREGRSILYTLRNLQYDREQESEADHIGLFLMTFAGYDPGEAVRFWLRMQQATGASGGVPEILSDHPSDARRIRDMRTWARQAAAGKRAFDEGRIAPSRAAQRRGPGRLDHTPDRNLLALTKGE